MECTPQIIQKASAFGPLYTRNRRLDCYWSSALPANRHSAEKLIQKPSRIRKKIKAEISTMNQKSTANCSYSVKYLGITYGQINVFTRRIPLRPKHITYKPANEKELPRPELYDSYLIHHFAMPRGLTGYRKTTQLESSPVCFESHKIHGKMLQVPANRKGIAGWKLTRAKSTAKHQIYSVSKKAISSAAKSD